MTWELFAGNRLALMTWFGTKGERMFSMAQQWRDIDIVRRKPDSVEHWDNRSITYGKEDDNRQAHDAYVTEFIEKMRLDKPNIILDMGCGTGLLAIPLAKQGHGVIAADFSKGMLARLREDAEKAGVQVVLPCKDERTGMMQMPDAQGGFIIPLRMSWDDDWGSFGLRENIVDVALASRSIITHDLEDSLRKLSRVARSRICVTANLGAPPKVNPEIARVMGVTLDSRNDAVFVFGVAHELGYEPEVSYIHSPRVRTYSSRDEAYHSLLKTLDYIDPEAEQVDLETAKQRLRDWLLVHLVPGEVEGTWRLDKPQIVPWAFLCWDVRK